MMNPSGPDLCYALAARKKARYLTRLYDSRLGDAGLSVSQFSILSLVQEHAELKLTDLANKMVMERTSLIRALKPLQAVGYLATSPSETGRSLVVKLTPAGTQKIVEAAPLWKRAQAEFEDEVGRGFAERQRNEVLEMKFKA